VLRKNTSSFDEEDKSEDEENKSDLQISENSQANINRITFDD